MPLHGDIGSHQSVFMGDYYATDCKFTRELIDQTVNMFDILCIILVMNLIYCTLIF